MAHLQKTNVRPLFWVLALVLGPIGCCMNQQLSPPPGCPIPRELEKVSLPAYVVEPPDILLIDALRVVPRPPYRIEPLDSLFIHVTKTKPEEPISGIYAVEPDGVVNLGFAYGTVRLVGLTLAEAKK